MHFTNPIYLWTLTALTIPVGIHLLSRKEGKVIRMGSLRHLQETSTQQFRGIRLNEILLLTLRCLMIILFALFLSGLTWNSDKSSRWLLVEKGLENHYALKAVTDSLHQQGYESRWLTEGFPVMSDTTAITPSDYRSLVHQLSKSDATEIVVFSQNRLSRFKGSRASLPSKIRWISTPPDSVEYVLRAVEESDSIAVRKGHTGETGTYFTNELVSKPMTTVPSTQKESVNITIVTDDVHSYDNRILKAALKAVAASFPIDIKLTESRVEKNQSPDWTIWLADAEPKTAGRALILRPSNTNELILRQNLNTWLLTKRLTEEVALEDNLTPALANLILPGRQELEIRASVNDRRMVSDSTAWSPAEGSGVLVAGNIPANTNPYLFLLLVALFVAERTIAYRKNQ